MRLFKKLILSKYPKQLRPLIKAINYAGGVSALSKKAGISHETIRQYIHGTRLGPVPSFEYCDPIEKATDGLITKQMLRPDIFGKGPINHNVNVRLKAVLNELEEAFSNVREEINFLKGEN